MDAAPPTMTPACPPRQQESRRHTYWRAVGLMTPALIYLNFCSNFLLPRLEDIWRKAGPETAKAQWLMDAATWLPHHLRIGLPSVIAPFVVLECLVPGFRPLRSRFTSVVVIIFNFAVMTTLVAIPTAGFLAAPLMAKHAREAANAPPQK
jgi:hypothetical protein